MAKAKTTLLKVLPIFRLIDGQTGLGGFPFHLHAKAVEVKSIIGLTTRLCKSARARGIRLDHLPQQKGIKMNIATGRRAIALWISWLSLVGVHPRAADADTPLDVYGQLPSLEDWALSPDGTKAVNVQTKGDDRYLLIRTLPGGQLLGGSRVGDEKLRSITWMDNDNLLIEISTTGGYGWRHEWFQLLTYNVPKRKLAGLRHWSPE
jgi:hypothetical protein